MNNIYEIATYSLAASKDLWNFNINRCLDYHEIAYSICSFIAIRYHEYSSEIAELILKYNFLLLFFYLDELLKENFYFKVSMG
jgi:hypothetical protein